MFTTILAILLALVVGAVLLVLLLGPENTLEKVLRPGEPPAIDFATLRKHGKPNQYLVCPPGHCAGSPDREAPVFAMSADDLAERWKTLMATLDNVSLARADEVNRRFDYVARTPKIRWPDLISVEFLDHPDGATLAVYSRAVYGYRDFGVNKQRIEGWLKQLGSN